MNKIEKILICGLGAIGGYYASIFYHNNYDLRVLVDEGRLNKYKKEPRVINGENINFRYITPSEAGFVPDLIIIATKSTGLDDAVKNIKNFVGDETVILSFLNGVTSEKIISDKYGNKNIVYSYLIGHTFYRTKNEISHDGNAKIVFGATEKNDNKISLLKEVFDKTGIKYHVSDNILKSMWEKFCFNCCVNQLSAITRMTFGEMKENKKCLDIMKRISDEVALIAEKEGITDCNDFWQSTLNSLDIMLPNGKTSMLQDIEAGSIPEIDIFGETVTKLGKKHNIDTPYNKILSELIELISQV